MATVNIHDAKTHLSRLIEQAARGEPVIIAKAGKPLVKLTALEAPARPPLPAYPRAARRRVGAGTGSGEASSGGVSASSRAARSCSNRCSFSIFRPNTSLT
jgi:prevent-host-death family protein